MAGTWTFLEASAAERAAFADLVTTLALPAERLLPRNRLREVRRVRLPHGTFYVKVFERTQWKNQLRALWAPPRCRHDAEREAGIAAALRAAGIPTARGLAVGRRGPLSVYVCAELSGRSLRDLCASGTLPAAQAYAAARFCGRIAARGILLADLSAEHVFARQQDGGFAVLDLHNGVLRGPRRGDARRWLRNFRRSLRGVAVPPRLALGFAARLLRSAGLGRATRALLAAEPPLDPASRYDAERSVRYAQRNPARAAVELELLRSVWPARPGESVLDAPCGAGRLRPFVAGERGGRWLGADRAGEMLRAAAAAGALPLLRADCAALPLRDRSVDGVVMFRFLHHLDPQAARQALAEAARVAGRFVVVSFFHPVSLHGLRRRLTALVRRRPPHRHVLGARRLTRMLYPHGFRLCALRAQLPYLRELWIAVFERAPL
jgi:SAM-dependent methyltransferase